MDVYTFNHIIWLHTGSIRKKRQRSRSSAPAQPFSSLHATIEPRGKREKPMLQFLSFSLFCFLKKRKSHSFFHSVLHLSRLYSNTQNPQNTKHDIQTRNEQEEQREQGHIKHIYASTIPSFIICGTKRKKTTYSVCLFAEGMI